MASLQNISEELHTYVNVPGWGSGGPWTGVPPGKNLGPETLERT